MAEVDEQDRLWTMPLSAPRWVWATYLVTVLLLAAWAATGGLTGAVAVVACSMFSFQFWTFVAWRGRTHPTPDDDGGTHE